MFIDETWTKTNMAPLRGWGPRGSRVLAKVPHGHWETTTFLAALRHDRIDAPWLLDGPIDGEGFHGASSSDRMKVSEKGAVSVYGMGRFPVTLYKEQWLRLLDMSADIRAFIAANEAQLKSKD